MKVSQADLARLRDSIAAYVEQAEGNVTIQQAAKALSLKWDTAKVTLLELAVLGRVEAALTSNGWAFTKKTQTSSSKKSKTSGRIHASGTVHKVSRRQGGPVLNNRIVSGLERIYRENTPLILSQANEAYHYSNPAAESNPEVYELFENGQIDTALESLNLPGWVIGRPSA